MMRPLLMILEDEKNEYNELMKAQKNLKIATDKMYATAYTKEREDYKLLRDILDESVNEHTEKLMKIRKELGHYTRMINAL